VQRFLDSLGPVSAIIGAQWGDEGKGKVIDILAEHFDVIARACGGANAGHTIVVGGKKHVFRLLPSGSLHPGKPVILGGGMVIHLPTLLEEITTLEAAGIPIRDRLHLSKEAHVVFEFHKTLDAALEERRAAERGKTIGTTKKGIGPAYMDKMLRQGIRLERLGEDLRGEFELRKKQLKEVYGVDVNVDEELEHWNEAANVLKSRVVDTRPLFEEHFQKKHRMLVEGAQATLLDIDHGTYPFVTSSSTTAAGALQGLGLAPNKLSSVIGVAKAYCTRVGEGDFPSEVSGETGDRLRERGGEYGSVTKRPRRCGWLSIPDLRAAAFINGFSCWNITKLDVLDTEKEIPVAVDVQNGKAVYKTFPGWQTSTVGITAWEKLPPQARELLLFIEKETNVPVTLIGTGPGREEMIVRES